MRIRCILRVVALTFVACAFAFVLATCGRSQRNGVIPAGKPADTQELSEVMAELDVYPCPEGVDEALWRELKDALEEALNLHSPGRRGAETPPYKITSTPPTGDENRVDDLELIDEIGGTHTLTWSYRNVGDYDQDGTVGIEDITPLAQHFAEDTAPENEWIDGDSDGKVHISDITPIAVNFQTDCAGYRIERADSLEGVFIFVQEVSFIKAAGEGRLGFSVPVTLDLGEPFVRVVAYDSLGQGETPSNAIYGVEGWVHTWGGEEPDQANALAIDNDGNVYVTGNTRSFCEGLSDILFLKYSATGVLLWQKTWGGSSADSACGLCTDSNGNVYIAGYRWSHSEDTEEIFLLEYSPSGDLLWQRTWGGDEYDVARAVSADDDGNLYVAGCTESFGAGDYDVLLLKYSPDKTLLWQKTWGGSDYDEAFALTVDGDGNVYVAGLTGSFGAGNADLILLKYSSDGTLLWQKAWGGNERDDARALVIDSSGNIYVAGNTLSDGSWYNDIVLFKYSTDGDILWKKTWFGRGWEEVLSASIDNSGNIIVAGDVQHEGDDSRDVLLLKYSPEGTLLWSKIWGGAHWVGADAVSIDSSGNLHIAGYARSIYGAWGELAAPTILADGTETIPNGFEGTANGSEGTPDGLEDTPQGVEDEGGGITDALVLRINQSDW